MSERDDGGPAYPHASWEYTGSGGETALYHKPGAVTLRDYFASKAPPYPFDPKIVPEGDITRAVAARDAVWRYAHADAMLKERAK